MFFHLIFISCASIRSLPFLSFVVSIFAWNIPLKVAQSCPTICNPMDYIVHGTLQVRILKCVAFPFSRVSSPPRDWNQVSCIADGFFTNYLTYPLVSPNFLNISLVFPILLFSSVSLYCSLKKVFYLSVLFSGTLHPIWYVLGKYYLSFLFYRKFITNFFQLHCFCLFF